MGDFPKDVSENLIRRMREWQVLSRKEIQQRMVQAKVDIEKSEKLIKYSSEIDELIKKLPQWISEDQVAREISDVIEKNTEGPQREACRKILRLFVFVEKYGPRFAAVLNSTHPSERRTVFDYINHHLEKRLSPGDVVESDRIPDIMLCPDALVPLLSTAMDVFVRPRWTSFTDPKDKVKFVKDIFDSPKGYSKTARAIPTWSPPIEFNFSEFLKVWLNDTANASIYDVKRTGETKSRKKWIEDEHGKADKKQRLSVWIQFAGALGGATESYAIGDILQKITQNRVVFRAQLPKEVTDSEINALLTADLAAEWKRLGL
jgi:hypothetical protein